MLTSKCPIRQYLRKRGGRQSLHKTNIPHVKRATALGKLVYAFVGFIISEGTLDINK